MTRVTVAPVNFGLQMNTHLLCYDYPSGQVEEFLDALAETPAFQNVAKRIQGGQGILSIQPLLEKDEFKFQARIAPPGAEELRSMYELIFDTGDIVHSGLDLQDEKSIGSRIIQMLTKYANALARRNQPLQHQ